ncbi:hypothetical protein MKW94_017998 [Papaver nudicaule]|uniref:RING-type E3 ubiquitin transferase n=1 Tax=Papaver nudicaule TaxID=74823 RepID=A0AA42B3A3_PAPNU|nr:hypothetical protein [Papaver nudicaule]
MNFIWVVLVQNEVKHQQVRSFIVAIARQIRVCVAESFLLMSSSWAWKTSSEPRGCETGSLSKSTKGYMVCSIFVAFILILKSIYVFFTANDNPILVHNSNSRLSLSVPMLQSIELEILRLKQELQQTMDMYGKACKDAISAKRTAHDLQRWKTEENLKYEQAKAAQQKALELAKIEQLKTQEAIEAAMELQKVAQMEARKAMEAEIKSHCEAEEKNKVVSSFDYCRYRKYSVQEIENATDNFAEHLKIGEGGYGPVYRCSIDHTPVAVKILRSDAVEGMQQFQQEVEILSCIRHPNMVLLLGACPENGCLVYEYMDNAAEIATTLLFLHQTKPEPLVHRDLKPGNILLDRNYTSKISDVGLVIVTSAAGTFCYIDPEYQQKGMLGTKSDVYSLGIMLLQIITARPPMGLAHYIARAIEKRTFVDMLDPSVPDWPVEEALAFAKIAIQCAEPELGTVVLPELNRLRELGMSESNEASLYSHAPWSYTVHSRPVSSVTSQVSNNSEEFHVGSPIKIILGRTKATGLWSTSRKVCEQTAIYSQAMIETSKCEGKDDNNSKVIVCNIIECCCTYILNLR